MLFGYLNRLVRETGGMARVPWALLAPGFAIAALLA